MFSKYTPVFAAVLACAWPACISFYAMHSLNPPRALPKDAPADQFSAYRAIEHDFASSKQTHPAGSKNNDNVANYILKQLQDMGLEAESMSFPSVDGSRVQLHQAIIGRIPGTDSTGGVGFAAHHDSVPYGPGATDDMGGCIAMLEAARAFMHLPRMRNDLVFVFTDAEEIGGYGSHGFCDHPLAKTMGLMNNLDVRGTKGPAMVYETSPNNGALIAELRKAKAEGVLAISSSLMYAVYKASPFGSDFTQFRNAGMHGYNIAYIDKFSWYHTANDSPDHVTPDSIQHFGAYVMGIGKHFGNVDFAKMNLATPDEIYFNTAGFNIVQYPMAWNTPLAYGAIAALLIAIVAGLVLKRMTIGGYLLSLILFPVAALVVCAVVLGMLVAVFGYENVVHVYTVKLTYIPEPRAFYDGNLFCWSFALMTAAITLLIYGTAGRWIRTTSLYAAGLTWMCPVLVAALGPFAGGSYLFTWPILFGAAGLCLLYFGDREEGPGTALLLGALLFATPALFLLIPSWQALMWMISILGAPLLALLVMLILVNAMPAMVLVGRVRGSWTVSAVAALVALLMMAGGIVVASRPSKERPRMDSVAYAANLDTREAWWMSEDVKVDEWAKQFFPEEERAAIEDLAPGKSGDHYLRATAPFDTNLHGLRADVAKDETVDGKRRVTLKLMTGDDPFEVRLQQTQGPLITGASIDGQALAVREKTFAIHFQMFPRKGYELVLETTPGEPLTFEARSTQYGWPEVPGVTPRPEYIVPEPNTLRNGISLRGEHMYVRNTLQVPASS